MTLAATILKLKSGIDLKYILRNGFWLGSSQVISAAFSLLTIVIITNYTSPETLGMYTYVISTIAIISSFTLTGLNTTSNHASAKGFDGTIDYSHKLLLKWGWFISIAAIGISGYYFINGNMILALCFILPAVFSPIYTANQQYIALLSGKKKFFILAVTNSLILMVSVIVLFIVLNITNNLVYIVASTIVTNSALSLLAYYVFKKRFVINTKIEDGILPYSKHLSIMNIFSTLSGNLDKLLIYHFLGPYQLAIYYLAITPVLKLRGPDQVISALAIPKMATKKISDLKKILPQKVIMMSFFLLLLSGLYIISAPFIFKLLFPGSPESVIYSQVFSIILVLMSSILFTQALSINRCRNELYIVRTSIPIIRIILFIILTPIFGIWGIITALILAQVINFFLLWYFFYKASDLQT
jgi:O-antigen/teichoic acid export membrane protein